MTGSTGLEDLYARLPKVECRKLCGHTCGPIVMVEAEWERLVSVAGAREGGDDLVCPYLERETGLCGVYEIRPLICRLGGVAETLPCPHGCEPERWLTAAEVEELLEEAIARSGGRAHSVWRGWERMLATAGGDSGTEPARR